MSHDDGSAASLQEDLVDAPLLEEETIGMPNEEFLAQTEEEQNRLIEYNTSVQEVYRSIEAAESARSWRVLFQRAPEETLPFIIYSVYVAANALTVMYVLLNYTGDKLPFFIIVFAAMVLPLLIQPIGQYRTIISWLRDVVSRL